MSYEWYTCYCRECEKMNLNDRNRYDKEEAWCTERRQYYNINDKACSTYFKYDEARCGTSSNCYITTIVCNVLGYSDKDFSLQILRNFRNNYLKNQESFIPILYEYDTVGPIISQYIKNEKNSKKIAMFLWDNYLLPTVEKIKQSKAEDAISKYIEMVQLLKKIYCVEQKPEIMDGETVTGKGYLLRKQLTKN